MGLRISLSATLFFLVAAPALLSHDPVTTKLTWTREISRIVYKRCAGCHRPGGSAFSLLNYWEARPWAKAIRDQVRTRSMPPWGAVKGIRQFSNDPSLSEPEIDILVTWVEGGAPEGDPAFLPSVPRMVASQQPVQWARKERVEGEWHAAKQTVIAALEPEGSARSTEVWIERKGGAIDRLLWLKGKRPPLVSAYVFREPVSLAPNDVLHATAPVQLCFR